MRKVYILPNLFTSASLMCGLLSIMHVFRNEYEMACYLIMISALLDTLDGKIARLTRTQSSFGIQFDSLADLVAFGVAPAMLIYAWLRNIFPASSGRVATGVSALFALCGAFRLARFNVQSSREERKTFTGLPIPGAACTVVVTFLAFWHTGLYRLGEPSSFFLRFLPVLFVGLSCLMVSNISYPSLKHIEFREKKPFDYLVLIIVFVCFMIALWHLQSLIFFFGFWGYVIWGVAEHLLRSFRHQLAPQPVQQTQKQPVQQTEMGAGKPR